MRSALKLKGFQSERNEPRPRAPGLFFWVGCSTEADEPSKN